MTITYRFFINITNIFIFEKGEKANMKIKNLLLVPLLSAALVATSCSLPGGNGGSGSTSDSSDTSAPASKSVSRITVQSPSSAVVGDEIDFDTIVEVIYDDNSKDKDYSLEAQAASASLVSIDGHKVKFIGEGNVNINVKAGGQSAKFSTSVLTREKAALKDFFDNFPAVYGIQVCKYDTAGNIVVDEGAKIVHQADYYGHYDKNSSAPYAGGYFCCSDGNIYNWSASDMDGTDFEAIPGPEDPVSSWQYYFVNAPLYFEMSDYAPAYSDVTGDFMYFKMTSEAAAQSSLAKYFDCAIDQLMYCAFEYNFSSYTSKDIYVYLVENATGGFDFIFELVYIDPDDSQTYGLPFTFDFSDDFNKVQAVEDYIASGEHPEAVDYTVLTNGVNAVATAKNYTLSYSSFYMSSSGALVDYKTGYDVAMQAFGAPAGYAFYVEYSDAYAWLRDFSETVVVTEDGAEHSRTYTSYYDGTVARGTPLATTDELGYIKHEGNIYSYSKASGAAAYTTNVTPSTDLWSGDFTSELASGLVPSANFVASGNERNDADDGNIVGIAASSVGTEATKLLNQTAAGKAFLDCYADFWQPGFDYFSLFYAQVEVKDSGELNYLLYMPISASVYFCISVEINEIGTSVLPVAESTIFPSA